jgi:2-polyprenyl-6-methoxyphenol hydroxylase-like FAD-dependent oxidoreductase
MRITIAGAGPAGLYFAYLMKKSRPACEINVIEQNAPDDTFGFGVVLSGRALSFLSDADAAIVDHLLKHMETWSDQHIVLHGHRVVIDGSSYSAISRLVLLEQLQKLCTSIGVNIEYGKRVGDPNLARECDVFVGADGANSVIRDTFHNEFGTQTVDLRNYFAWYGVKRPYPAHTLTFISKDGGAYCGHHYRYTPDMSTFVAEMDAATWTASGFDGMTDDERRAASEVIYSEPLGNQPLVDNRSTWRRYHIVKNSRWHHGNIVLIGDALRTAHPSIGSGTRLAIEDSIALWRAFEAEGNDIGAAFARYQREREPIRDKLNRAAENSIAWYEDMASKMQMHPLDFTWDYMMRTGVMTRERLERECPTFMAQYRAHAA